MPKISSSERGLDRAVLIDLDGTLIDSIPALKTVYHAFLNDRGCRGSEEEFQQLNGQSISEIVRHLAKAHALDVSHAVLYEAYLELVRAAYENLRPSDEAQCLLQHVRSRSLDAALVTTNLAPVVDAFLETSGWKPHFRIVVTGDQVRNGKPDPEIYELALRRLGVPPSSAVAIEDSVNGVRAAVGAGIRTICVEPAAEQDAAHRRERMEAGAWAIVSNLHQAARLLDEWLAGFVKSYEIVRRGDVRLQWANGPLTVAETAQDAVEEAWRKARAENDRLFNGELLVFDRLLADGSLMGRFAGYKYFVARLSGVDVAVQPVGVSGLLWRGSSILYGTRSAVTQYRGRMELVPSGSVDRSSARPDGTIKAEEIIFQELTEESGYARREVQHFRPLGVIFDRAGGVYDLAFELRLEPDAKAPVAVEYDALRWANANEVADLATRHPEAWVPTSLGILELAGLLQ